MNELTNNEYSLVFGGDGEETYQNLYDDCGYCDIYDKNNPETALARCYLPAGIASDYISIISKISFGWGSSLVVDCQHALVYEDIE